MTLSPDLRLALQHMSNEVGRLQRRVRQLEANQRASQLANASIDGGTLTITDGAGNDRAYIGLQSDGTITHTDVNAPPPDPPDTPGVLAAVNGLAVTWDGLLTPDGGATTEPVASDFDHVEVHASPVAGFTADSTTGSVTLQGTLHAPGTLFINSLDPTQSYYVLLIAVNTSGLPSAPSAYGGPVQPSDVSAALTPGSITETLIANNAISTPKLQVNSVTATAIAAQSVTTQAIAANSVTGAQIAAGSIIASHFSAGTVVAGIVDSTIINTPTIVGSVILGYAATPRGPLTYDFEDGTDGWLGSSGTTSQSAAWSSLNSNSLLLTCDGTASPYAFSPNGTGGIPCVAGEPVSVSIDLYAPTGMTSAYIGISWFSAAGNKIGETDSPDTSLSAGQSATLTVSDNNTYGAAFFNTRFGTHTTPAAGTLLYGDNVMIAGNLAFSASPGGGIDPLGNIFDQGIEINSLPGMTSGFTVQDAWGANTLAAIDAGGNISGQSLNATGDVTVGGTSLLDTLASMPQGEIARTGIFASSLPAPGTPSSSEFYLYELDVQLTAARSYLLVIEPFAVVLSQAGKVVTTVYATTDGSNPSNASPVVTKSESRYPSTSNLTIRTNAVVHPFASSAGALWRLLVSINSFGVDGGGAPTMQIVQLGSNPGDDAEASSNARFSVYDMGAQIPNTGGVLLQATGSTGPTSRTYTTTYTATDTYSYQGSDGHQSNQKINHNGRCYQGGDFSHTYNGKTKTWIVWPATRIQNDLAGATVNWVHVKLNNNHTWFNGGMTVCFGYDRDTVFGSTKVDPSGSPSASTSDLKEIGVSEGVTKTFDLTGIGFGSALAAGTAYNTVLYKNSNNLKFYGYFAGANASVPPQLIVNYTR